MTLIARTPRGGPASRIGWLSLLALLAIAPATTAQQRSPFPPFDPARRVHLGEGVAGDYGAIEKQIASLEKAKPGYHFDVVVVRSAGPHTQTATRDYTNELVRAWQQESAASGRPLDEARSLIVVVALDNKQVAVHPGGALSAMGLHSEQINQEIVEPSGFIDLARQDRYPEAIVALLRQADRWIGQHEATTGRDLAIGLLLSLAVIAAAVLGSLWFLHRRTRGQLDERIKEIRSRATDVMDRLDALKERLKLLPATDPDFKAPMAGATAALYAKIQDAVGKLWDRWLQVMDSIERAQKLALSITSPFKRKALRDAEEVLKQGNLFDEIDAGTQACTADMDRLNQAHEEARNAVKALGETAPRLDAQIESIRKLGLPTDPYQDERKAIDIEAARASDLITSDPIGARTILESLRTRAEALIARVERIAGLFQDSQKAASELDGLKRQTAEHRAKGLRLDEEGGNPDTPLAQADRAQAATLAALRAGDPDEAARQLAAEQASTEQARSLIEQVRNAREYCRREQPERLRTTERLRAALPHAEESYRRLEREFAPSSWEGVRPNLDQVRGVLSSFDQASADAAAASSDDAQRYLAGAAILLRLAQQQQAALRLMSGIGDRLNALSSMRDESRRRRGDLEAAGRRVEGYFRQNDPSVGAMALDILDQARRGRDAVLDAFDHPRPDWPSIREGLDKAMESFKVAQDQAEVDVRSHAELGDAYERTRAELERVADLLASRHEDRKAANQRFRSAAEVLDQVGVDLSQPHGEWPRLLDQVRGAAADLEQSERLAREDIRLAAQAQSEIDEASRSIEQTRGYYAMGVGADTMAAESALDRAQQLLGAQHYEQAIESAGQAHLAARRAHQDAMQQAAWRQMQADARRRHWEGARGAPAFEDALSRGAAVATGVILGRAMEGAADASSPPPPEAPEPAISPEPPPTDTSVTSWESDTGQASW